jgi:hypothetical protein
MEAYLLQILNVVDVVGPVTVNHKDGQRLVLLQLKQVEQVDVATAINQHYRSQLLINNMHAKK